MTEEHVPIALADAHTSVGEHHVPAAVVQRAARTRAEEVDQELLLTIDTVFPAVCPEAAELRIGAEPGQQVIHPRRDRLITTKALIKGLLFIAHRLLQCDPVSCYSILTGSPRRTVPPRTTAAYTPTLTWLCWAAVRRIPGSLERSPCARVVITQRPQGPVMFRRTAVPMASVWPIQAFSAKPFSPEASCTTMFGRNRRTSKRPCGYSSRR